MIIGHDPLIDAALPSTWPFTVLTHNQIRVRFQWMAGYKGRRVRLSDNTFFSFPALHHLFCVYPGKTPTSLLHGSRRPRHSDS